MDIGSYANVYYLNDNHSFIISYFKRRWMVMSGSASRRVSSIDGSTTQNDYYDPFSQTSLDKIFKMDPVKNDRLASRENTWLEFKENFNWAAISGYGRTSAAFANTKGGYIIFGVKNNPRIVCGMSNDSFENTDPSRISTFFKDTFSPEIEWEPYTCLINGKNIGLLYIHESRKKPIISQKNNGEIKDGEIYYRYHGHTERIKHQELNTIIEIEKKHELEILLKHLKRISRVGVRNAAILNTMDGSVVGAGGMFVIDESLLPLIKFIREGEFSEVDGAPTLKLVGDISPISDELLQPVRTIYKNKPIRIPIRTPDIICAFLNQEKVHEPIEYIKEIAYGTTGFLPIYYFIQLSKINKERIIELLESTISRSPSKQRIIERLSCDESLMESITNTRITRAAWKKMEFRECIIKRSIPPKIPFEDLRYFFQAIRSLDKSDIDSDYLLPILKGYFDAYYESNANYIAEYLRKAICHIDIELYKKP